MHTTEPKSKRQQHLDWCKQRALQYCDIGDTTSAWSSMVSDMSKEPETAEHAAIELGNMLFFGGHLSTVLQMREFIQGFN